MRTVRRAIGVTLSAGLLTALPVSLPAQETEAHASLPLQPAAESTGCYGASCNDRDPAGLCDSDAITVGVFDVYGGRLELRYSPACAANWGRYTPYKRDVSSYASAGMQFWPRVTVWNPNGPSFGVTQGSKEQKNPYKSWWTKMTDGTKVACTGAEVYVIIKGERNLPPDAESQGWQWGPCY
ncbi:DUF2690 domain-containing protein [Streptomyces sp. NPDC048385]|uniref:DUF2690 domain-containing protein n=1 Tax=Streptomyces sp. NPDC048385 TaxID=3155145 RepID=UPI00342B2C17